MTVSLLSKFGKPILASGAALVFSLPGLHAGNLNNYVQFGQAASSASPGHQWAIFSLGQTTGDMDSIGSGAVISGDIGAAGAGNVSFVGNASDTGVTYYQTGGTVSGRGVNKSAVSGQNNFLTQGVSDARNASAQAVALQTTLGTPAGAPMNLNLTNTSQILHASDGNNDRYVLTIASFSLNNSKLTLDGSGNSNAFFVFNITNTFSFVNASNIMLTGGLTAANVIFNYLGSSPITLGGGATSTFNGLVLAAGSNYKTSTVNVAGLSMNGEIIADKVSIASGTTLTQVIVSP